MTDTPDTRIKEILRQIPLFSFLNEEEFETVARLQTEVSYPKGATICTEGDEGDSFLTVLSGEVEVRTKATGDSVVSRCGPGEFMGEMSLLMGGKRTATLPVSRSTRLLVLDRDTPSSRQKLRCWTRVARSMCRSWTRVFSTRPSGASEAMQTSLLGNVTGALLLGGESTRMGRDKARLEWRGETLSTRAARLLAGLFSETLLVGGDPEQVAPGRRISDPPCKLGFESHIPRVEGDLPVVSDCRQL